MSDETGTGQDTKLFSQAELDDHIKKRLQRASDVAAKKAAEDKAEAVREAKESELRAKENWEGLDETRKERIAELEGFEAKAKKFDEYISTSLKARIKALSDEDKKLYESLPGDPTDLEKLGWLTARAEAQTKASGALGSPKKKVKTGTAASADLGRRRERF